MNTPKPGDPVTFRDGGNIYDGICNGDAKCFNDGDPTTATHVPVHVPDTDKNILVALSNIVVLPVTP